MNTKSQNILIVSSSVFDGTVMTNYKQTSPSNQLFIYSNIPKIENNNQKDFTIFDGTVMVNNSDDKNKSLSKCTSSNPYQSFFEKETCQKNRRL